MKTFTLRLDDTQAEMLERLAAFNGKSKNVLINELIAHEYVRWDYYALWYDGIVADITIDSDLGDIVAQYAEDEISSETLSAKDTRKVIVTALRAYDYSINKMIDAGNDERAKELEERKESFLADYYAVMTRTEC